MKSLHLVNFTVFSDVEFRFGRNLNVFVGENGSGKTHLLTAIYAGLAGNSRAVAGRVQLQQAIAAKLMGVFRPDSLGRLVHRTRSRSKCSADYRFDQSGLDLAYSFSTLAESEVSIRHSPTLSLGKAPAYLPTRELLTIFPGFVSLYETTYLSFEETWRDTCILLGAPLARGPREATIKKLLLPLEEAMGGKVELDGSGRFYLRHDAGKIEMHLVAEGLRKLATLARLIATGSLLDQGYLFWDEPEANLNPRIIKSLAKTILQLAQGGIQVFLATHSLFLLRELHILQSQHFQDLDSWCVGLHSDAEGGVTVEQGKSMDDIGSIVALDEELQQSDRYIDTEMGLSAPVS